MADAKVSALVALGAGPAETDEFYIRDVSEAAADESKRITAVEALNPENFTAVTAVVGTDEIFVNDAGVGKKATISDVLFAVPYQIQLIPEVPQGTGAFPNVHALDTTWAGKITGAVFPTDVDGTFNLKADQPIPAGLPTTPVFTVRLRFMASSAQTSTTVHIELFYANIADGETYDATAIDDIADAAPTISATIEVPTDLDLVLVTKPVAGDHFICKVIRDVSEDSYAGSVQLVMASLIITGS